MKLLLKKKYNINSNGTYYGRANSLQLDHYFSDTQIWEEKKKDDAIYIHRLVANPKFRDNDFVTKMVKWAKVYAVEQNKKFIRLDTLGNNTQLIAHYVKSGFTFLGIVKLANTATLPMHYQLEPQCCLFEIEL